MQDLADVPVLGVYLRFYALQLEEDDVGAQEHEDGHPNINTMDQGNKLANPLELHDPHDDGDGHVRQRLQDHRCVKVGEDALHVW